MAAPCEAKTSFQRRGKSKNFSARGTRPSLHNGQLLISTGVPSLDHLLGGGLVVGSVLLIEEDTFGSYANLLLRYFLAEGVMCGHGLMVASAEEQPKHLLKALPHPVDDDKETTQRMDEEKMKIAWRYQHLPQHQLSETGQQFGHSYDLNRLMGESRLTTVKTNCFYLPSEKISHHDNSINPAYQRLFSKVESEITEGGYSLTADAAKSQGVTNRNILRLGIHSLASPLWEVNSIQQSTVSLCRFLHALRGILRVSLAVCVLTIPTHLYQDESKVRRIERLCDTVIRLESFAGSDKETNPVYKEYHGLFHIRRLPRLNSLTSYLPDSLDLAFKLRRKKLTIEKLHLPPDLSETVSRSQEDPAKKAARNASVSAFSCSSSLTERKLDF
ncbi:elongator complex protein 4-like [Lytechinus variegatus]|uniref:elongator complex protein 4-like n=1 Tax=Lytechinus variegatus TaxID=7654 RepID=UPI001BB27BD5|nr:elongator complex protein 4-like [Lytechinus variegatus]